MASTDCPKCGDPYFCEAEVNIEASGKNYNHEFGQTEHWAAGTKICAACGAAFEWSDSSL